MRATGSRCGVAEGTGEGSGSSEEGAIIAAGGKPATRQSPTAFRRVLPAFVPLEACDARDP